MECLRTIPYWVHFVLRARVHLVTVSGLAEPLHLWQILHYMLFRRELH